MGLVQFFPFFFPFVFPCASRKPCFPVIFQSLWTHKTIFGFREELHFANLKLPALTHLASQLTCLPALYRHLISPFVPVVSFSYSHFFISIAGFHPLSDHPAKSVPVVSHYFKFCLTPHKILSLFSFFVSLLLGSFWLVLMILCQQITLQVSRFSKSRMPSRALILFCGMTSQFGFQRRFGQRGHH